MKLLAMSLAVAGLSLIGCGGGGGGGSVVSESVASSINKPEDNQVASKVVFKRTVDGGITRNRTNLTFDWGEQTVPAHSSTGEIQDFMYAVGIIQNNNPELKTQYANFTFESKNLFTTNPNFHFAVILKHEGSARWNRGRGFIVGNLEFTRSDGAPGCSKGMTSAPETWFTAGNEQPQNSVPSGIFCGEALNDNQKYKVQMHTANDSSWYYEINDMNGKRVGGGNVVTDNYITNPQKDLINDVTRGFALGMVFADNKNAPFEIVFDNLEVGWR